MRLMRVGTVMHIDAVSMLLGLEMHGSNSGGLANRKQYLAS